jgi:hypothetical protein
MRIPYDVPVAVGRQLVALAPDVAAAVLLTLEAGWTYASSFPDVHAGTGEVPITERLRDGMRQALKTNDFAWSKTMIIAPGTESRSRTEVLLPDGRTDIPLYLIEIFLQFGEHDPHAIIECKRIAGGDTQLCREYVVEGIDRFRNGKYGENHNAGFMAGYVLSGDAAAAAGGVNAYLTGRGRHDECLGLPGVLAAAWVWSSRHSRASPSEPIELHHAFFRLRAASRDEGGAR